MLVLDGVPLALSVPVPVSQSNYPLMLLILLDEIQYSSRECAISICCWFYRNVWAPYGAKNIVDNADVPELVVTDRRSDRWDLRFFESKN